ncbi:type II toxin-antitoxin system RelE/ParE family toxin [Photorhabdus khanii]|uniref:type II toxin-antitoxin system RelE/ParE family toxin n=1 Tax=Photorhabdus khanii TaxID=1004150 RepID=UPI001FD72B6F|nr:type II toxin-antitoxin system RelE/ParE family toxin [Photorhabdus khanii]
MDPEDWKPFSNIGSGVKEMWLRDSTGIYRIMYVVKFDEAIYVLHSFQKKTKQTNRQDKDIAKVRYNAVIQQRGNIK